MPEPLVFLEPPAGSSDYINEVLGPAPVEVRMVKLPAALACRFHLVKVVHVKLPVKRFEIFMFEELSLDSFHEEVLVPDNEARMAPVPANNALGRRVVDHGEEVPYELGDFHVEHANVFLLGDSLGSHVQKY